MVLLCVMKTLDLDRERSEMKLSLTDFQKIYNEDLPPRFPRASLAFLREFRKTYPGLFKGDNAWSLDQHRKKFMDWPPQRVKSSLRQPT